MSKWIKMTDKKPSPGQYVLMYTPRLGVFMGHNPQETEYEYVGYDETGKPFMEKITHWAYLPEPPGENPKETTRGLHLGHKHYCSICGELAYMEKYCSMCGTKVKEI